MQFVGRTRSYGPAWAFDLADDFGKGLAATEGTPAAPVTSLPTPGLTGTRQGEVGGVSDAAEVSGAAERTAREPMGEAHNAAHFAKLRASYAAAEKAGDAIESLMKTGQLPDQYVTKADAAAAGWEPGKALANHLPGKEIGGDVFQNRPPGPGMDPIVPEAPGRTWHEADIDSNPEAKRSRSPGTRLIYSNDGKIYVSADHYNSAHPIGNSTQRLANSVPWQRAA